MARSSLLHITWLALLLSCEGTAVSTAAAQVPLDRQAIVDAALRSWPTLTH